MTISNAHPAICWQDLPNGIVIQESIEERLAPWWPKVFGYHMLSIGPLSQQIEKPQLPIGKEFSLAPKSLVSVVGDYHHLPIQSSSIDAIVSSFLLEFDSDPYQLLRESDRVLIAGGYLFIIGFNPLSPVFTGKLFPAYQTKVPWCGHFFRPSRVKDWLGLLGYQVLADERLLYHHLMTEVHVGSIWQHALEAWLPSSGSVYIIVARKLESPLTPIQEKQKVRQPNWATAPTAGRNTHAKVDN
ncbi:class I SAM-dependent methyltransferase [Shewanella waksmanii]|uniref:class I SAM-dependent methyltransferase n=1 Tax=Shewanella waksmanii TaxID=213783 RepID=UPI0037351442